MLQVQAVVDNSREKQGPASKVVDIYNFGSCRDAALLFLSLSERILGIHIT